MENRTAIFIGHANPEDNEFAIWLGAHLSAAGYEVWADVLNLPVTIKFANAVGEILIAAPQTEEPKLPFKYYT